MITTLYGYLEAAYLVAPYLSGFALGATQSQLEFKIESENAVRTQVLAETSSQLPINQQLDQRIEAGTEAINTQIERQIAKTIAVLSQLSAQISTQNNIKQQLDQRIDSGSKLALSQLERRIEGGSALHTAIDTRNIAQNAIMQQFDRRIANDLLTHEQLEARVFSGKTMYQQIDLRLVDSFNLLSQFEVKLAGSKATPSELGRGPVSHQLCEGYLVSPYCMTPYLAPTICAHLRQQMDLRIRALSPVNTQLERTIEATKRTKQQLERRIEAISRVPTQLLRTSAVLTNSQLLISIYNTTNLRILYDFPSRGTSGSNWAVVAGGTAAGDRGIANVNTDIVEQVYRSTATAVTLQCDTQISQGIFLDTLAILGHNLTTSSSVTLQGSNDITFSSTPFAEALKVERENLYYIAPTLPLASYRYWRLVIVDTTNAAGYIEIGTIVFGSSIIFNGECFTDEVIRRKTHFADRIRTEGYSSVSNDRALKRGLGLRFQKLNYNKSNYENLIEVVDYVRTSLKALWIPTPQYPSRFAVFGKLAEIPVETHKAISEDADYIDLEVNVDEAL